jgi:hypothetical protein
LIYDNWTTDMAIGITHDHRFIRDVYKMVVCFTR